MVKQGRIGVGFLFKGYVAKVFRCETPVLCSLFFLRWRLVRPGDDMMVNFAMDIRFDLGGCVGKLE